MDRLGALGITSLLIEGGSRVIASALSAGIVEKIFFFFAPKILGGDDGVPICKGQGADLMKNCIPVKDISVRQFGKDVMIQGYIDK
jgi:diaminohydroxyphosphoribosylaminopyrimidine deaminase/5-amino-6-(5-phosphoribosylamino)uracil reductase